MKGNSYIDLFLFVFKSRSTFIYLSSKGELNHLLRNLFIIFQKNIYSKCKLQLSAVEFTERVVPCAAPVGVPTPFLILDPDQKNKNTGRL